MRRLITLVLAISVLTACHTEAPPPAAADPIAQDTDGVIARFTHDIWPVIEGHRYGGDQGSPVFGSPGGVPDQSDAKRFRSVIDPSSQVDVRDKVRKLGKVYDADDVVVSGPVSNYDSPTGEHGLHLASTSLVALKDSVASVAVCYTYIAAISPTGGVTTETRPGASEATFALHKTDNWYLSDITNDHVVPDCQSSKA